MFVFVHMGRSAQEARKSHQNPRSWSPGQLQPSPPECWELKSGPLKRTGNAFGSLSQGTSPEKVVIDNFVSVCVSVRSVSVLRVHICTGADVCL